MIRLLNRHFLNRTLFHENDPIEPIRREVRQAPVLDRHNHRFVSEINPQASAPKWFVNRAKSEPE